VSEECGVNCKEGVKLSHPKKHLVTSSLIAFTHQNIATINLKSQTPQLSQSAVI